MTEDGQLSISRYEDGRVEFEVNIKDKEVWVTLEGMSLLFQKPQSDIQAVLRDYFDTKELDKSTVMRILPDPDTGREIPQYNIDAVMYVGYVVKSSAAMAFRKWATAKLHDYVVEGFVINPQLVNYDTNHFMDLLRKIRYIRVHERDIYKQITDIFATSSDYNRNDDSARHFFETFQNKLHYAVTGQTAGELIVGRCDSGSRNMGMTSWRGTTIKRNDARNAKNYLTETELRDLTSIVSQFLDLAESFAQRNIPLKMADWQLKLNALLKLNEMEVLDYAGTISSANMKNHTDAEFDQYQKNLPRVGDLPDAG